MATARRRERREKAGRPQTENRIGIRGFPNFYNISKTGEPRLPIKFVKGAYPVDIETENGVERRIYPYDYEITHYVPSLKPSVGRCSAGIAEVCNDSGTFIIPGNNPCTYCHTHVKYNNWGESSSYERPPMVSKGTVKRVYSIVILAWFHKVKTGKKNRKGYDIFNHIPCKGRTCKLCGDQTVDTYFGKPAYTSLGQKHSTKLDIIEDDTIARTCACGGKLVTTGFKCPHCEHEFSVDWDLLDADEKDMLLYAEDLECEACNKPGHHYELVNCSNSNCDDTEPLTVWDSVLWLERSGTDKDTTLELHNFKKLDDFFTDQLKNGSITEEEVDDAKSLFVPIDRRANTKILSPEEQAHELRVPNPFESSGEEEYREYDSRVWDEEDDRSDSKSNIDDNEIPF